MVALIAEITGCSGSDICLMTKRVETPDLMPLGRQLELIITSPKAIAGNLLRTDLANSKQKCWAALGHSPQWQTEMENIHKSLQTNTNPVRTAMKSQKTMLFPSLTLFTEGTYFQVIMPCTLSCALCHSRIGIPGICATVPENCSRS